MGKRDSGLNRFLKHVLTTPLGFKAKCYQTKSELTAPSLCRHSESVEDSLTGTNPYKTMDKNSVIKESQSVHVQDLSLRVLQLLVHMTLILIFNEKT